MQILFTTHTKHIEDFYYEGTPLDGFSALDKKKLGMALQHLRAASNLEDISKSRVFDCTNIDSENYIVHINRSLDIYIKIEKDTESILMTLLQKP
jgi:hypothetical protein